MPLLCDLSKIELLVEHTFVAFDKNREILEKFCDAKTFLRSVSQDAYVEDGITKVVEYKENTDHSFEKNILNRLKMYFDALEGVSDEAKEFHLYFQIVSDVSDLYEIKFKEQ